LQKPNSQAATQNAIGFALSLLLDPSPGDAVTKINIKKVFATCRGKFCSINASNAPVGRFLDEGMRQERTLLVQTETKARRPLAIAMVDRIDPMV
jgi:hypothetical protein